MYSPALNIFKLCIRFQNVGQILAAIPAASAPTPGLALRTTLGLDYDVIICPKLRKIQHRYPNPPNHSNRPNHLEKSRKLQQLRNLYMIFVSPAFHPSNLTQPTPASGSWQSTSNSRNTGKASASSFASEVTMATSGAALELINSPGGMGHCPGCLKMD